MKIIFSHTDGIHLLRIKKYFYEKNYDSDDGVSAAIHSVEFRPQSRTTYTYDARGNVLSVGELPSGHNSRYSYDGDKLDSLKVIKGIDTRLARFAYDNLGRMTYDGLTGQTMTYNDLDLLGKVEKDGSTLANYSYLSDGTKLSAADGNGKGLVYRGPFVYRKSSGSSSLKLESAAYSGGRVTPGRALLYVTDYLGNVRAVVDGSTGAIYKVSDYSTFGEVYSGRASGKGSPQDVVKKRDANHHKNSEGYGPAVLDKSSTNSDAIRGQEQYLIDANGGAKSQGGSSGNAINGISNTNPKKQIYEEARRNEFGN